MSLSMTLLSLLSSRTFCCFPSDDLSLCPSVHLSSSQSVSQYNRPRLSHRTLRTLTSEWLFLRVLWQADLFNSSSVRPSLLLSVSPSCSPTCLTPCLSQDRSGLMGHFTDLQPSAETRAARLNRCTPRVRGHVITFDTHTHTHTAPDFQSNNTQINYTNACRWTRSTAHRHTSVNIQDHETFISTIKERLA